MQTERTIVIDAPIEHVFDVASNRVGEWSTIVVEDKWSGGAMEGVGAEFEVVTENRGKRMDFQGVVTAWDPPFGSESDMFGQYFNIYVKNTLEDLGGKTRLTQISSVNGKGFFKIMFALTGWMMKKSSCDSMDVELAGLKRVAEEA
ncbi:MAG: hypothetical protein COA70_05825 [Planctomycetota bacterium]|nr:MAG: hypothetical protein COA70_05825 [Planctomycetota bacterium]